MPAPRASAVFEPISPDLDLPALVEATPNFEFAPMIQCDKIDEQGIEQFEKLVLLHVILGGKPLVVQGFQHRLDQWTFSTQWLRDNVGKKFEQARDLNKGANLPLSINHYLDNMGMLTNQWNAHNYKTPKQRLYLKDIDCPELWHDKLKEKIPPTLFYLNEQSDRPGGPDSRGSRNGLDLAPAGDLMSCLPSDMRAENMMCYIGHEGTYTPAHREMCASLGQNIMVEASGTIDEDGKPTKPGSSIWFMTESKDRHLVAEYWLSTLGHDIEVEGHFAQINAWAKAPFKVYIVEQKVGDFILIPPLAPHQVWNRGTRTMKAAWNRTTVETLALALNEALPRARMVCRDEQYKNKAIVLFSLNRYSALLKGLEHQRGIARDDAALEMLNSDSRIKQLQKDFRRLFKLYNQILLSEMLSLELSEKKTEYIPFDSFVTCSYCRCNIFNRFLTCKSCVVPLEGGEEDTYDICLDCYAMGRSCHCLSKLTWVEQFPWRDLVEKHEMWRRQLLEIDARTHHKGYVPRSLNEEHELLERKTLAEVCQTELGRRPFQDPKKEQKQDSPKSLDSDIESNEDGTPRKRKKRRSEKWLREHRACHICGGRHPIWKMAICECGLGFCYGSLWRGFETMPQTIMEDPYWRCPKCREICNCSACRKNPHNKPYQPSGTILGHDTRKFADPRSIEALVDFSFSNKHWLKKAGDDEDPTETRRMHKRKAEAEKAKARNPNLDDEDDDDNNNEEIETGEDEADATESTPLVEAPPAVLEPGVPIDPLLVESMIGNQGYSSFDQNKQVAMDALNAMQGMSTLEQDPASFMAFAGLSGTYDGTNEAEMIHTSENGITYGIPHPDALLKTYTPDKLTAGAAKKSKKGDRKALKTKGAGFTNDANRRFSQAQTAKTMAKAKQTGRLISARAALTGHRLLVKFKVPRIHLARFLSKDPIGAGLEPVDADNALADEVRSDLPLQNPSDPDAAAKAARHKRRRLNDAADEDFDAATKRYKRQSSKQKRSDDANGRVDSDSESDLDEFLAQSSKPRSSDSQNKRRSLPRYLAQRNALGDSAVLNGGTNGKSPSSSAAPLKKKKAMTFGATTFIAYSPSKRGSGRPPQKSATAASSPSAPASASATASTAGPPSAHNTRTLVRRSILNKSRGGKVKIVSERGRMQAARKQQS